MGKPRFRVCHIPKKEVLNWKLIATFDSKKDASEFLQAYADQNPELKQELFVLNSKNSCVAKVE